MGEGVGALKSWELEPIYEVLFMQLIVCLNVSKETHFLK